MRDKHRVGKAGGNALEPRDICANGIAGKAEGERSRAHQANENAHATLLTSPSERLRRRQRCRAKHVPASTYFTSFLAELQRIRDMRRFFELPRFDARRGGQN